MTPQQGALKLRGKATALRKEIDKALNQSAKAGVKLGRANSSGPFSLPELAAAGHPYARRRPNPAYDPAIINVHRGRFRAGWQAVSAFAYRGGRTAFILNLSDVAGYLKTGTRFMVRRPVDVLTMADVEPVFWANVLAATRRAVRA